MVKIIVIILITIIILGILGIIYKILFNRLQNNQIKINEAFNIIDECLKNRYDYVIRTSHLVKKNLDLDIDIFKEIEKLKVQNISNIEMDKKINEAFNIILQLKEDYPKLEGNRGFKDIINDFNESNEKIEATKAFYDNYAKKLNALLNTFPSNIIGKIHHINKVNLYNTMIVEEDLID